MIPQGRRLIMLVPPIQPGEPGDQLNRKDDPNAKRRSLNTKEMRTLSWLNGCRGSLTLREKKVELSGSNQYIAMIKSTAGYVV